MLVMFAACSDDTKVIKEIVLDKGTATNQTIYSDETSTKEGISFTATEKWTATVTDISTRAAEGRVDWLKLSQYDGGAGKFTLTLTIEKNDTGSDRKAEIKIVCGETTITVVVEQKAITSDEAGTNPDQPQSKKKVKTIKQYDDKNRLEGQADFSYDNKGRIAKLNIIDVYGKTGTDIRNTSFTYKKQDNGNLMIEVKCIVTEEGKEEKKYIYTEYLYCDNTRKVVRAEDNAHEYEYEYDNQNQLIKSKEFSNVPAPTSNHVTTGFTSTYDTTDFTWSNRNMVSYKSTVRVYGNGEITYTNIKNDANIDLAYFVCFGNSTELLICPYGIKMGSICGCFGKRVANMPATVKGASSCSGVENHTFEYKRDAEGYINEVNIATSYGTSYTRNNKYIIEYTD